MKPPSPSSSFAGWRIIFCVLVVFEGVEKRRNSKACSPLSSISSSCSASCSWSREGLGFAGFCVEVGSGAEGRGIGP